MSRRAAILNLAVIGLITASAAGNETAFQVRPDAAALLDRYCQSCHEDGTTKGDVRLDNLAQLPLTARLDLLNRMQEQIYIGEMPPKKKTQPTEAERWQLVGWVSGELGKHNASKLEEKLRYPGYGNAVDHVKLFSGRITDAPYTPARRWLVSPQIFEQRVFDALGLEERERVRRPAGVTNPFLLPDASGVRYYDNNVLDGGHLLLMLTNADSIANQEILSARIMNGEPDPADQIAGKKKKPDAAPPRKRLKPSAPAFEAVILKKSAPTDDEIKAAISTQFDRVLRREPTVVESGKYLKLTRDAIALGGNTEGLKEMLKAVLLESEFLYRLEFGAGPADRFGRKMLSPREGAYAISYALGDKAPDPKLLKAASSGQLNTREDYKREVLRLLDDKQYYRGDVEPAFANTKQGGKACESSHPRIVRFFREFFGYPNAVKIFKDSERSGFFYQNPERGTFGTAGTLVNEADLLVQSILNNDQHVFERLLGSEEFYVAPQDDSQAVVARLNAVYDRFKDINWHFPPGNKNPDIKLTPEDGTFIEKQLGYRAGARQLVAAMTHVDHFRKLGLTPNPVWNYPFGIQKLVPHANSYNISPPEWDYPKQQPFKVANRTGILTHPAWLIAHSQNTQNDPVTRGRWVREKLLAGRTPDIPITVDAVIPEDHNNTLRTRLENVTSKQECWKCHQHMNPLGVPFESYDDFGRFRTEEPLEHPEHVVGKGGSGKYKWDVYKTLPVDSRGVLEGTGDPALDGPVSDASDLIGRLVKSARARQSIIRYAFRFYMGRNEMLSDSRTLIDADNAYVKSGGSFKAVIVSLLTSDSFIYRK